MTSDGKLESKKGTNDENAMDCRGHLSARLGPPRTINEGLKELDWTTWTWDSHGGGYPVHNARQATVPKLDHWGCKLNQRCHNIFENRNAM